MPLFASGLVSSGSLRLAQEAEGYAPGGLTGICSCGTEGPPNWWSFCLCVWSLMAHQETFAATQRSGRFWTRAASGQLLLKLSLDLAVHDLAASAKAKRIGEVRSIRGKAGAMWPRGIRPY